MKQLSKWHVLNRILRVNAFYRVTIDKKVIASVRNSQLKFSPESMHDFIQFVDYEQTWKDTKSYFQIYQSYTWIDWLLSEMILSGKEISFKELSQE